MCVNLIDGACDDVERMYIINVAVKYKPEITQQGGLLQVREAQRVPHIMSDSRVVKMATSHYDSSTAQRTSARSTLIASTTLRQGKTDGNSTSSTNDMIPQGSEPYTTPTPSLTTDSLPHHSLLVQ